MQVAIRDYSQQRRALDQLRYRLELERIVHAVTRKLIRSPAREIDITLTHSLKLLSLFASVERCFLGKLDSEGTRLSISHEWCVMEQKLTRGASQQVSLRDYPRLGKIIASKKARITSFPHEVINESRAAERALHLEGTRTWGWFPLSTVDSVNGVLGFDALGLKDNWSPALTHLFQTTGQLMLHGLSRKENELDWFKRHKNALRQAIKAHWKRKPATPQGAQGDHVAPPEELEIDLREAVVLDSEYIDPLSLEISNIPWRYEPVAAELSNNEGITVPLIDQQMQLTCPQCMGQDMVDLPVVEALGKQAKAICGCGYQFVFMPEQRGFYRKSVALEGIFRRVKDARVVSDSLNYEGKLQITNLSKQGLGFVVLGANDLNVGDRVRVRFTLDNIAQSQITKTIEIRSSRDEYAGGRFIGTDKDDITLGFYLM
jgi:hypothetical protein